MVPGSRVVVAPVELAEVARKVSTSKAQQLAAAEEASSAALQEVALASSAEVAVVVEEAAPPVRTDKAKREAWTVPMVVVMRRGREVADQVLEALGWEIRDACISFSFVLGVCVCEAWRFEYTV